MSIRPKTIRARVQQVFVVDGVRPLKEHTAAVLVSEKQTWAELYDWRGKLVRRRLGTKAFFTRKDAEVRKLGELRKIAARPDMPYYICGRTVESARQQLKAYKETGVLH